MRLLTLFRILALVPGLLTFGRMGLDRLERRAAARAPAPRGLPVIGPLAVLDALNRRR